MMKPPKACMSYRVNELHLVEDTTFSRGKSETKISPNTNQLVIQTMRDRTLVRPWRELILPAKGFLTVSAEWYRKMTVQYQLPSV